MAVSPGIVKQHDTWPPLRFKVEDQDGLVNLTSADSIKLILAGPAVITGSVDPIDPPDADGFNASYTLAAADTATVGTYRGEIEVNWDSGALPQAIETFPNSGTFTMVVEADLG